MKLSTYSKSVYGIFFICIVVAILVWRSLQPISDWMTDESNETNVEDVGDTSSQYSYGTFYFLVLVVLNSYVLFKYFSPTVYSLAYFVIPLLLVIWNPRELLSRDSITLMNATIGSLIIFLLLNRINMLTNFKEAVLIVLLLFLSFFAMNVSILYEGSLISSLFIIAYALFYIMGIYYIDKPLNLTVQYAEHLQSVKSYVPKLSYILVIEVLVIVLIFYIRGITKSYYGGTLMVHTPISLRHDASYKTREKVYSDDAVETTNYDYSFSYWINLQSTSSGYDYSSSKFIPILTYQTLTMAYNSSKNSLRTTSLDGLELIIPNVPLQTWNHIVLSNNGGIVDVFMNGILIATGQSSISTDNSNHVLLGAESGVKGELCTALFFPYIISTATIESMYNGLKTLNPPIF